MRRLKEPTRLSAANFFGGILNLATMGNGCRVLNALGMGDLVHPSSGWYTSGEVAAIVTLAVDCDA